MHSKQELDRRLEAAGVSPLKKLGQNFLLNPDICKRIVETALEGGASSVVEIGPGLGALTDELIDAHVSTVLVELDAGLVAYWTKRIDLQSKIDGKAPHVRVVHEDALQLSWPELGLGKSSVLMSNLPYSIAASLVVEMSAIAQSPFSKMVLMFQKEVGERITASVTNEDYGMLSVVAQANWDIKKVIDAGPQDFYPVPHVGSRVLEFKLKDVNFPRDQFVTFIKRAFAQRRKKLTSNLSDPKNKADFLFTKDRLAQIWQEMGLNPECRAQELTPETFLTLFKKGT